MYSKLFKMHMSDSKPNYMYKKRNTLNRDDHLFYINPTYPVLPSGWYTEETDNLKHYMLCHLLSWFASIEILGLKMQNLCEWNACKQADAHICTCTHTHLGLWLHVWFFLRFLIQIWHLYCQYWSGWKNLLPRPVGHSGWDIII